MATSQQWRNAALLVAVSLAVLCIGSADAWGCPSGFKGCHPHKPGCETCIQTDVNNCGDCGKKCKSLPYTTVKCQDGKCSYSCKAGWADCDNNMWSNGCETDIGQDARNCGRCDYRCKQVPYAISKCNGGKCEEEPVCKALWGNCDGNMWSNGCEKDLGNDIDNCGSCGRKCPCSLKGGEPTCSYGKCGEQCKAGSKYDTRQKCCV